MSTQKVVMVGTWHLGSVIGCCLAEAGNQVALWDQNSRVAEKWKAGTPPIHEPGLQDLVNRHWNKNLIWSGSLETCVPQADWIVLAYDTPINDQDEIILTSVEEGFNAAIKAGFKDTCSFFFTSQLPVGTSQKFREKILKANKNWKGHVVYQPENLRLGDAIKSFQNPDRMVLGVDDFGKPTQAAIVKNFQDLLKNTQTPLNVMSLASAEMVKHALNSFLATCVVFANEIAEICEKTGADAWDVVASMKQDSRVGPKAFLRPGLGFAGGTLARDVKTLKKLSAKPQQTNFFKSIYTINTHRNDWVCDRLKDQLQTLAGKNILLLGITYKPMTSTVRRSPALEIGQMLRAEGATCVAIDPMADLGELTPEENQSLPFRLEKNFEKAFEGIDGAVVVTEWPQFKEFDWKKLAGKMKTALVVDTKNLLDKTPGLDAYKHIIPGKPL